MKKPLDRRLDAVLANMLQIAPADVACIHSWTAHTLAVVSCRGHDQALWEQIAPWIETQITTLTLDDGPQIMTAEDGVSVLLWPLVVWDSVIGAVTLVSRGVNVYTDEHLDALGVQVELASAVLENSQRSERLIMMEAVAKTARAIAQDPSPQRIAHVLRDYLFDVHVVSCYIALYGPVQHDHPGRPFEYLEIKGAWSHNLGNQFAVGQRFNIAAHLDFLEELHRQKYLIMTDFDDLMQATPLLAQVIQADNVKSLALLPLESDRRKLGVIGICTDQPYAFNAHELRTYQIISEFLTVSTVVAVLRQQADYVQRGRAALLDAVTDSVVMVQPNDSVLTINQRFTEMFGVMENAVQGLSLCHLLNLMQIPGDVRADLSTRWQGIAQDSPTRQQGEFKMVSRSGQASEVQWYSGPVYQNEAVIGRIYTFHDITADRAAERLRYDLLSRVSHELRTPLTSIQGFAQFILEASGDELPQLAREYTEIILQSAGQLKYLFNDMIEISQAANGQLKLELTTTSLMSILEGVQRQFMNDAQKKNQCIVLHAKAHLPPVQIDPHRITQVVIDVVQNAIKYAPDDTEIVIHAQYMDGSADLPPSAPPDVVTPCILTRVIDQGKGLTSDEVEKVFLPFYRVQGSGHGKGVGLGLAIARSLVELHRGKIWAEAATPGEPGGRFLFTIPATFHRDEASVGQVVTD